MTMNDTALPHRSLRDLIESPEVQRNLLLDISDLLKRNGVAAGNREEKAMEALQDAYEKALRNQDTFRPGVTGIAWLKRLARNAACDRHRSDRRRWQRIGGSPDRIAEVITTSSPRDEGEILELVNALNPSQREAVLDRYYRGLPPREIARRLGLDDPRTVHGLLHRARANLRKKLERIRLP